MKILCLFSFILLSVNNLLAQTNQPVNEEVPIKVPDLQLSERDSVAITLLKGSMNRMDDLVRDYLVPLKHRNLFDSDVITINQSMEKAAYHSLVYSARDFAGSRWSVPIISESIGGVDEERINPLDPAYQNAEESWWKRLKTEKQLHYGFRPLNSSPYVFISSEITENKKVILLTSFRYYFKDFSSHHATIIFSVPLVDRLKLTTSIVYSSNPNRIQQDHSYIGILRLDYLFFRDNNDCYAFVGTKVGFSSQIIAGINIGRLKSF